MGGWRFEARTKTRSSGGYTKYLRPKRSYSHRVYYPLANGYYSAANVRVTVRKAAIKLRASRRVVGRGAKVTFKGSIKDHTGDGMGKRKLYLQRWKSGKYRTVKSFRSYRSGNFKTKLRVKRSYTYRVVTKGKVSKSNRVRVRVR